MRGMGFLVSCFLFLASCGTIKLEVPEGRTVRLLEEGEPAEVRIERTVWFWLWGGRPISDNSTKQDIEQENLREVRFYTENTFFEGITNPITAFATIVRRTLIVEGNR